MNRRVYPLAVLIAIAAFLSLPGAAPAAVTVGSPLTSAPEVPSACGKGTFTTLKLATGTLTAPYDGVIVRWRMKLSAPGGIFNYKLRVLRPAAGGKYTAVGTGPAQTAPLPGLNVLTLPTPVPIKAGDLIGLDCPEGAPTPYANIAPSGSTYAFFAPPLSEGQTASPGNQLTGQEELVNADVVGTPQPGATTPARGPLAGGRTVTVTGSRLGDVTAVSFGGAAASSVVAVSETELRATAPPHAAGTVEVKATNAAGTGVATGSFTYLPPPTLGKVTESRKAWRLGRKQASISVAPRRPPVGTTFGFELNEAATVSLAFSQVLPGRKVGGRCVGQTRRNLSHPRCRRLGHARTLSFAAHTGANRVLFQGRLPHAKPLKPGRYSVSLSAESPDAGASSPTTLSFRVLE